MMVSSKGRYALRVMLDMAEQGDGAGLRLSDIAQRQQLSKKYLESIMAALSRAGLVESSVGKAGGYRLTRPPGEYPVGEILRAAEQLFCQKGYEAASMQEIVRAAGVSKGGIYHHFASKEEIMTLLSHQHAQESAERAEAQLADAPDDLARLNLLLSACLPMRDEAAAFTAMLLPMATSPEGRAMALTYLDALSDRFHPLLEQTIAQGVQSGALFTEIRGVAGIVLHLLGDCFFDLAAQLMQAKNDKQPCDLPALVDLLTRYRRAVEVLLNAPFGSVTLLTLEDVEGMAQRLL